MCALSSLGAVPLEGAAAVFACELGCWCRCTAPLLFVAEQSARRCGLRLQGAAPQKSFCYLGSGVFAGVTSQDNVSYWGSYCKCRKSCVCAFSSLGARAAAVCAWELGAVCPWKLGCWCRCRVPLLCALGGWSRCCVRLGAGAAAGCRCCVHFGDWLLVLLRAFWSSRVLL